MKITIEIPEEFADLVKRGAAHEGTSVEVFIARCAVDGAISLMSHSEAWPLQKERDVRDRQSMYEGCLVTPTEAN